MATGAVPPGTGRDTAGNAIGCAVKCVL